MTGSKFGRVIRISKVVIVSEPTLSLINYALDVLAGDLEPLGDMPYDVKFHEKGHVFY